MLTITFKEFKDLFKSIKSIIIILFIISVTLLVASLFKRFSIETTEFGYADNIYSAGLMILLYIFSPFFVASLSHNLVNHEVENRTIRFIATKTSRSSIILGKFFGHFLFWIVCIFIALLLITPFSKEFYIFDFFEGITFLSYFVGFTLLLSVMINKSSTTMFLTIATSFFFSIVSIWGIFSQNYFVSLFSKLTPYYYFSQENRYMIFITFIFTIIFILFSVVVFKRKEL